MDTAPFPGVLLYMSGRQVSKISRPEAMARKAARTSKTERGAKRRSVIMSVLVSLSKRLERFTLSNVLAEIKRWLEAGLSIFQEDLTKLHPAVGPP